jgi:RHS repeat-associated protein
VLRVSRGYWPYGTSYPTFTLAGNLDGAVSKRWTRERYDAEAGLQYLNARYYDPELAMFIQPDWWEVTEPGVGTNRYAYAVGDPVNMSDANGNFVPALIVAGVLWAIGAEGANAPGPDDADNMVSSGDGAQRMVGAAVGMGVAGVATKACLASPACLGAASTAANVADKAGSVADVVGCANLDPLSCASAVLPGVSGLGAPKVVAAAVAPKVVDAKLQNFVEAIFSGTKNPNRHGDGSLMTAAAHELAGGTKIYGQDHVTKAKGILRGLQRWAANPPSGTLQSDITVATELIDELRSVFGYK